MVSCKILKESINYIISQCVSVICCPELKMALQIKSLFITDMVDGKYLSNETPLDHKCSCTTGTPVILPLLFFLSFRFLPFKFKGIPVIINGTPVMKLINEVNLTGTVFEIIRNL
jgi:hypothetical protein